MRGGGVTKYFDSKGDGNLKMVENHTYFSSMFHYLGEELYSVILHRFRPTNF